MDVTEKKSTHFGFESVGWDQKQEKVNHVFDQVANRYDIMNDVMSMGLHRIWKREFVTLLNPQSGEKGLDVAGGSGDIAYHIYQKVAGDIELTVSDINPHMLKQGQSKMIDRGLLDAFSWLEANAEELPLQEGQFDFYTISFGLRNVRDIQKALREAYRILRPGGRFYCLEFSHVSQPLLAKFYDAYSFHIIPKMGALIAGERDPYSYLVESIRQFPQAHKLKAMMSHAGFEHCDCLKLSGGVVAVHSGWKI